MFTFKSLLRLAIASNHSSTPTFSEFITKALSLIPNLSATHRPATLKNYHTAIVSLKHFAHQEDVISQPVCTSTLQKFEIWLKERGISPNTSSCYIRSLRSLYNTLYPQSDKDIFKNLFTGNMRTTKRALTSEAVKLIIASQPPRNSHLRLWHDVFLFSVYALGMPFVDLAYLRWSDISEGFINYRRRKTNQPVSVPITIEMSQIMNSYRHHTTDNLVFPILQSHHSSYHFYQHRLTQYNLALKQISQRAQLKQNLTSYVARHTWATLANRAGIDISHISQAMGHTNISTTQIYLNHISNDEILNDSLTVTQLFSKKTP